MNELREPFDPEKIERPYVKEWGNHAVYTTDYDQLLAANREQKAEIERLKQEILLHEHLRASVDEKPEDAWKRGQEDMMKRVILPSFYGSYPPVPYVAPTLPGEEK